MTKNPEQNPSPSVLHTPALDIDAELYQRATRGLPPGSYVATWRNLHGELMVFTQRPGARDARMLHSDALVMEAHDGKPIFVRGRVYGGMAVAVTTPALILSDEERLWLTACWLASKWVRAEGKS